MRRARKARVLTVVCTVLLLSSACGPRSPDQLLPETYVDPPAVSAAARAAYGQDAQDAYEDMADFLLEHSTPEELLDPTHGPPTEAELVDDIVGMMTPKVAQEWRRTVTADLAGDAEARDVVRLLRFHTWDSEVSAPRVGTILRAQSVTDGTVDVVEVPADSATATSGDSSASTGDPAGAELEVTLTHWAMLRLVADDVPIDVELVRPLVLSLEQVGDDWLIAAFEGTLEVPLDQSEEPEDSSLTSSPGR